MRLPRFVLLSGLVLLAAATTASATVVGGATNLVGATPLLAGMREAATSGPPTTAQCEAAFHTACYSPLQIERAYDMAPLYAKGDTGRGKTIVLVDSFGSPTIRHDLRVFDKTYGLPAPPSFRILRPDGRVPPFNPNNGTMVTWAAETTLDVSYSHAIAPGANLILVETPVAETEGVTGFPQIVEAENYVINHNLGAVISQSFGATEETFPTAQSIFKLRSAYKNAFRHHVTVLASSGDQGATSATISGTTLYRHRVVNWPASDPLVTGVGGTELHLNAAGKRVSPDTAWNDTYNKNVTGPVPSPAASSGGLSVVFSRPAFQGVVKGVVGAHRGVPDIAMSAACNGSVLVYLSFIPANWYTICGTSEASPEFAGIVAIADQVAHTRLGLLNPDLYLLYKAHAPGIVDVTRGNNTVTFTQGGRRHTVKGFSAKKGYDLVTGVGTVNAAKLVPELASLG